MDIAATANAILTGEQILSGNALELGNIDNSVTFAGDIATEASGAIGLNMISGDFNLQKNAAVLALIADTTASETYADTSLLQSLFGQALGSVHMRNAVSVDLNATGDVAGNVGLNAASGAFNTQSNAIAIAAAPGSMLAQSFAGLEQHAQQNRSTHQDVVNDVAATIIWIASAGISG